MPTIERRTRLLLHIFLRYQLNLYVRLSICKERERGRRAFISFVLLLDHISSLFRVVIALAGIACRIVVRKYHVTFRLLANVYFRSDHIPV